MSRTRKVFLSYAPEDEARSAPIIRALKDSGLNCWRAPATPSGEALSTTTQRELERRSVFIRLCSPAMQACAPAQAEAAAFRQLQAAARQQGRSGERLFVDIILDAEYQPTPGDSTDLTINAAGRPVSAWIVALDQKLGTLKATREISRGTLTVLVGIAVLIGFLLLVYMALHVYTFGVARPR